MNQSSKRKYVDKINKKREIDDKNYLKLNYVSKFQKRASQTIISTFVMVSSSLFTVYAFQKSLRTSRVFVVIKASAH